MKIDYRKLEKEYMTTTISISALAKKYGYGSSPIYRYSKAHHWEEKKAKKGEEQVKKAIEKEDIAQEEAWERLKNTMRQALDAEWRKLLSDEEQHLSAIASLTKATKDARDMGVFGATLSERKLTREIEALEKQLSSDDTDKSIVVKIEGGDDYAQ